MIDIIIFSKNDWRVVPRHRRDAGRGGGRIPMRRAGGAGGVAEQVPPYGLPLRRMMGSENPSYGLRLAEGETANMLIIISCERLCSCVNNA